VLVHAHRTSTLPPPHGKGCVEKADRDAFVANAKAADVPS
jgi:hypothetical protein